MTLRTLPIAVLISVAVFAQGPGKRMEFDVASIKPSPPLTPANVQNVGAHLDGAQVSFRFLSLQDYIIGAYNIKKHQIAGGPDWLSTERFDITAKVPDGVPPEQMLEKRREMMQVLIEDRFKLKFHRETRELPVYALVVTKAGTKLTPTPVESEKELAAKAVDVTVKASNTGTTVSLPGGGSISYGFLVLEGKKVTMQQLVDNLARFVDRPVIDDTGLKGGFDFKLDFSLEEMKSMMRTSGSDPNLLAGVPEQGTSIMSSLQSMGLKLEARRAPMEVLVVDKIEKAPSEN
jgi:uncharacterized protein (TIGR03435 family)